MKILTAKQLQELDQATMKNEPIASIDLMERAAAACSHWLHSQFPNSSFTIISGTGNNGGDGLAIARQLTSTGHRVHVMVCRIGNPSDDFQANFDRLGDKPIAIREITDGQLPHVAPDDIIVDAIFGYGLSRPIGEPWNNLVKAMNDMPNHIVAIDLPSGLMPDTPSSGEIVEADDTLTFEVPKLAFFIPENHRYTGRWTTLPINLDKDVLATMSSHWLTFHLEDATTLVHSRSKYDHKGNFGHALLIVGSFGMIGAAILSATAALRSGVGKLTIHVPRKGYEIMQITVPEAMVLTDRHDKYFSGLDTDTTFTSIGIGCGLGTHSCTLAGLSDVLGNADNPVVVDADGLNLLAREPDLLDKLPENSILTPHIKEFERLFGECANHFERLTKLRAMSKKHGLVIILKGAHTAIATPDGLVNFNMTGNPGMATAGSGDVLTGMLTGLLAQGYTPRETALLGVCLHGLAGDLAAQVLGVDAMVASDMIEQIGPAFQELRDYHG